jgi:hypothetical protein
MSKLSVRSFPWGEDYSFYCPGCGCRHGCRVRNDGAAPSWSFNGDMERPTFSPSLLTREYGETITPRVCHLFLSDGRLRFLSDCTHHLAGQTVDLPDLPQAE